MNNNTNETCTACGGAGELAVIRLATGNLVLDAACALHRPPGAMAPAEWAADEQKRCEVFPRACDMARSELLHWLFRASGRPHIQAWNAALSALTGEADAWDV
jgi:hypothetical protein